MGPWVWLAFALSGLSSVAVVASQLHSISGYAQGGIVGGGSYVGDKQIIRVNSGEAVLTQSDQARFIRMLDGANEHISRESGQVEFKVRGSDLVGVLTNYHKKHNKLI